MVSTDNRDREKFLEGMRYTASAVNIVTTDGSAGKAGVTVSAMTPVSADGDKPTLLVCVHHLSPACQAILENKVFGVSILSQKQSFIADTFAGRIQAEGNDKFNCTEWIIGETGVPLVLNSLVSFECHMLENTRVGSHHIFIGGVQNTGFQKDELPLIYSNRAYGSPASINMGKDPDYMEGESVIHHRIRTFNTKETYPEQNLNNDLSQGVVAKGTMVFLRGQVSQDLETRESLHPSDPTLQTRKTMENIKMLLEEAGSELDHVCRIVVYLTDIRYREEVYQEMGTWLKGVFPCSTGLVVSSLARPEWLVEIEVTAVIPEE